MWDFCRLLRTNQLNELLHKILTPWMMYLTVGDDTRSGNDNWFVFELLDKDWSLMWFEWKLLHKWYFKVTKELNFRCCEMLIARARAACCLWNRNHRLLILQSICLKVTWCFTCLLMLAFHYCGSNFCGDWV